MTALIDTLFQIEKQLGIETDRLMPYAEQDTIGGFHPDPAQRQWDMGAIFDVEGRALYAVIRALKPQTVVEVGSGTGCSATHICAALVNNQANDGIDGHLTTVDRGNTPQIPDVYQPFVTILPGDGIAYLALLPDNSVDFILEDADHTTDMCQAVGELARTKLKPGGALLVHDAAHWAVGADVRKGYDLAGLDMRVYLTDPSDCGWGVWKRPNPYVDHYETLPNGEILEFPKWAVPVDTAILQAQEDYPEKPKRHMVTEDGEELEIVDAPPAQKVKRTRKPKAAK